MILFLFWPLARCPTLTAGRVLGASDRNFGVCAVIGARVFVSDGTGADKGVTTAAGVFTHVGRVVDATPKGLGMGMAAVRYNLRCAP